MATAPERGKAKAGAASVHTLKRRAEFLATRKGGRWATPHFVLEGMARVLQTPPMDKPRFGFTVSKQVGKAVERNRIRRRLKAAVRDVQGDHARPDFDYVLIARRPALEAGFSALVADLVQALERVHAKPRPSRARERPPRRA